MGVLPLKNIQEEIYAIKRLQLIHLCVTKP